MPERVEKEIETIVTSEGLELVHIEYRKQGHGFLLRIDIDKDVVRRILATHFRPAAGPGGPLK